MRSVDLYSITADGSRLEKVVDTSAKEPDWLIGSSMTYFDMSPDGSRLAFSACTHHRDPATEYLKYNSLYRDWPRGWAYNYDMALANIDGTDASRLTHTPGSENFPVWSPDGTSIAYFSSNDSWGEWGGLKIHTLATGDIREIEDDGIRPHPPSWSPDGEKLAFVGYEWFARQSRMSVWTVGADGSNLTRIAFAASGPAWSPDGKRIAMAVPRGPNKASLYTFAADGSDPTFVSLDLPEPWDEPAEPWLGNLSWSPDGSAILLEGFAHAVNVDGTGTLFDGLASLLTYMKGLNLPYFSGWPPEEITFVLKGLLKISHMLAAWSPDGSKIAIRTEIPEVIIDAVGISDLPLIQVLTMDRDGSNPRVLVKGVESDDGLELRLAQ